MSNLPIGCIFCYPSPICPEGFLPCDGRELSKKAYPELYAIVKGTWGETSTTFFLPDLQGQFVRGWDKDGDVDPFRKLGSLQNDSFQGHIHGVASCSSNGGHFHYIGYSDYKCDEANTFWTEYTHTHVTDYGNGNNKKTDHDGSHTHEIKIADPENSTYGEVRIATETRPKNIALMYCIKAK